MSKRWFLGLLILTLLVSGCEQAAQDTYPGEDWPWAETPEALGWSTEKLAEAQAYAERIGSAAVMIVDDGLVVHAWGDLTRDYHCHSMRKSLMSALYGIYVAEGTIDLTKTLADLDIDDSTPLTEAEKQATVADLLKARSGVYIPAAGEVQAMRDARPERGSHAPGTFWYYNNWDFNALGSIFDQETGEESIYQAFQTRIAGPIGMQDYQPETLHYEYEPYSRHPYYGFRMSTRDLARFGLLFLRQGRWEDQQILSPEWVEESTATHSERGPDSGYGYMWWTGVRDGLFPNVRVQEHSYYASGLRGHNVIVLPYRNLVIVHRVDTDQPEGSVEEYQLGALLWLILDAAGETEIGESPFLEAAPGRRLAGEGLRQTVASSTWQTVSPLGPVTLSSADDGTLSVFSDEVLLFSGKWWIEDDQYCLDLPPVQVRACSSAVLDGTTLRLYEPEGVLWMRFD